MLLELDLKNIIVASPKLHISKHVSESILQHRPFLSTRLMTRTFARLQTCASQLTKFHGLKELAQARWSFSRTGVSKHHPNDGKRDDARSTASGATKRSLPL